MKKYLWIPWCNGMLVVLASLLILHFGSKFPEYVFARLAISKDAFQSVMSVAPPLFAALIASYGAQRYKILLGLSFALLYPVLHVSTGALFGIFQGRTDFPGLEGAYLFFKIQFALAFALTAIGTCIGVLSSNHRGST